MNKKILIEILRNIRRKYIERLEYEAFYIKPFEIEGEKIKWIKNIYLLLENAKKD